MKKSKKWPLDRNEQFIPVKVKRTNKEQKEYDELSKKYLRTEDKPKWPLDRGEVYTSGNVKRTPEQQKAHEEAVKKFEKHPKKGSK